MYSGTTFRTKSGRVMGVHQKIDRVAHRHITTHIPESSKFPAIHEILHFEGLNGPDGIKRKSPAKDEPWHYIDPNDPTDRAIVDMINDHIYNLARALRENNTERAAFEAAWMAHAIVDGLTPAHHYPLEEKLEELRGGEGLETRRTTKDKLLLPGKTRRMQLRNNWEFWGAKGVMTTHLAFELGVATTIAPLRFEDSAPDDKEFERVANVGFETVFFDTLRVVADLKMYEEFAKVGWTRHLARETRNVLVPNIIRTVTLAWYQAVQLAGHKK
jgi:hypothetical protein